MISSRIKTGITIATASALTAGAMTVLPSFAATSSTSTATTSTPATAPPAGPRPGGPGGGPPALRLSQAAMHPDPPTGAPAHPQGPGGGGNCHPGGPMGGPGGGPGAGTAAEHLAARTKHYDAIAKELGKDGAAVTAAVRGAIVTRLDKSVSEGKLTADERSQILKNWDQGGPDKSTKPSARLKLKKRSGKAAAQTPPTEAERAAEVTSFRSEVAKALGVSTDELVSAINKATPAPPAPPAPPAGTTTG